MNLTFSLIYDTFLYRKGMEGDSSVSLMLNSPVGFTQRTCHEKKEIDYAIER